MNLLDYIKGNRRGKEAHRIEKDAMRDPFLYEAIEGFDSLDDDHLARINQLRGRIGAKSHTQKKKLPIFVRGVAASVVVLIGLGGYFLIDTHKSDLRAQEALDINIIDIYVPTTFYKEHIAVIAQHNTEFTRSFKPNVTRFSISAEMNRSITQSELDMLAGDLLANNDMPIVIYMPNEDRYSNRNVRREVSKPSITHTMSSGMLAEASEAVIDMAVMDIAENITGVASSSKKGLAEEDAEQIFMDESVVLGYGNAKGRDSSVSSSKRASVFESSKATRNNKSKPIIGYEKYDAYLLSALQRPTDDVCKDKKGKVLVEFSINKDGTPYDLKIVYGLCFSCDEEAMRMVQAGPKWTASDERVTVKVQF